MNKIGFSILTIFFLTSCSNSDLQQDFANTKKELKEAQSTIAKLQAQIQPEGDLVHLIFFKLKPEADIAFLAKEIQKLENIDVVKDLQHGAFEDLGDKRALSEYQYFMEMSFVDKAAYKLYQKHPLHLKLKEKAKPMLAGPPAAYDYMKE